MAILKAPRKVADPDNSHLHHILYAPLVSLLLEKLRERDEELLEVMIAMNMMTESLKARLHCQE